MSAAEDVELRMLRLRVASLEKRLARLERRRAPKGTPSRSRKRRTTIDAERWLRENGRA